MAEGTTTTDSSRRQTSVDPSSGFCIETRSFRSLRPPVSLPPPSQPLSAAAFVLSLLPSPLPTNPALVDAATDASVSYPQLLSRARHLQSRLGLSKGHVAFILSPASLDVPLLYLALLSAGAVITPANPAATAAEISHLFRLSSPTHAFAISSTADKLPRHVTPILLDSSHFRSLLHHADSGPNPEEILQLDPAAILYSSGTTGRMKAAVVPHRSFITMMAGFHALRQGEQRTEVTVVTAPMFHSLGFFYVLKGLAMGETVVVAGRCGVNEMLRAAERHGATEMVAAPPVVLAMGRSEEFHLKKLVRVHCGGAPLSLAAAKRFAVRFPTVDLCMGYGSTEAGGISRMIGHEECRHLGSVGRLTENVEVQIMDNVSRQALSIHQQGELWIRGPAIMTGYIGDDEANASTFDSDGWLKTGDICYIDQEGFLFVVDRLKELIKYKAYQVPPAELEHLLQYLPGIVDAAVIPYPDEEVGQIPMAFVVRHPGSNLSEAEVMEFVAKQVAPYKKIRRVAFICSIPRSSTGKILRRELVNYALRGSVSML